MTEIDDTPEHVFLVAFQVHGNTRTEAEQNLLWNLPRPTMTRRLDRETLAVIEEGKPSPIECWWVAEDDRNDRSDNDSAVFVDPGAQPVASALLAALGLTGIYNRLDREGGQFTGTFEPVGHDITRYQKARAIREVMTTLSIGMGDLDLIDALDSLVAGERLEYDNPRIEADDMPAAFEALAAHKEYEWHGAQEHLWQQLREHTRDAVRETGLLIEQDEEES